jgi:hypothetical protein
MHLTSRSRPSEWLARLARPASRSDFHFHQSGLDTKHPHKRKATYKDLHKSQLPKGRFEWLRGPGRDMNARMCGWCAVPPIHSLHVPHPPHTSLHHLDTFTNPISG